MSRRYVTRGIYALLLTLIVMASHGSPLLTAYPVDIPEKGIYQRGNCGKQGNVLCILEKSINKPISIWKALFR